MRDAQIVIGAVPSAHAREAFICRRAPFLDADAVIVSATKGLEPATHLRMSEVIAQVFALQFIPRIAVLSGPFLCAGGSAWRAHRRGAGFAGSRARAFLQEEFAGPTFRLYTNEDVLGVELGRRDEKRDGHCRGSVPGAGLGRKFAGGPDHARAWRR